VFLGSELYPYKVSLHFFLFASFSPQPNARHWA
jgi:hypothetical protein